MDKKIMVHLNIEYERMDWYVDCPEYPELDLQGKINLSDAMGDFGKQLSKELGVEEI